MLCYIVCYCIIFQEDSLLISTQFKGGPQFKATNEHFIKSSGKTISIQPVGSNKIDNVFWNSSRKSNSINLSLNISRNSLNNSDISINNKENNNINEMETQVPYLNRNENPVSIFEAQTQMPREDHPSQSIHNVDTQMPFREHLPEVCRIPEQCEMKFNLYTSNKKTLNIHEAETQDILPCQKYEKTDQNESTNESVTKDNSTDEIKQKVNTSDGELLFDDFASQSFQDDLESQYLLPKVSLSPKSDKKVSDNTKDESNIERKVKKRVGRIESYGSTDCEDLEIIPSQKLSEIQTDDGDETDCEDILNENNLMKSKTENLANEIKIKVSPGKIVTKTDNVNVCKENEVCFEDMLTQIVQVEDNNNSGLRDEVDFEDLPTQVIDEVIPNNSACIEHTQQYSEEIIGPFKIPLQTNNKIKLKDSPKSIPTTANKTASHGVQAETDQYYQATQDIYNELCSQENNSEKRVDNNDNLFKKPLNIEDAVMTHSFQNDKPGITFAHIENRSLNNSKIVSSVSKEYNEKVTKFVTSLSKQQIRDVIGVNSVYKLNRIPSDSSDESTPKKLKPSKLMDIDLPNSQEIKASVHTVPKHLFTDLSSDSESENNSEEQYTPILHRKKGKPKTNSKSHNINKLNLEALPTRINTRVRKATAKFVDGSKKSEDSKNILRHNFLPDQDDDIDKEIITENILRLKSKLEKNKSNRISDSDKKSIGKKTEDSSKIATKTETQDIKDKNRASKEKENKTSNSLDTKKDKEIESESTNNKRKNSRSVRSSKTRHKIELQNKPEDSQENKEIKAVNNNKSQRTSDKSNTSTGPSSHTTSGSGRTTRSSRNKGKMEKGPIFPKPDEEKSTTKPAQKGKKENDNSRDKVVEVRRSTRQRTVKDKKQTESHKPEIKSILKRVRNYESAVYDATSDSDRSSSKNLKRPAANDNVDPKPKRTRSSANSSTGCLRSTPARNLGVHRVLFTAFPPDALKPQLESLGKPLKCQITYKSNLMSYKIPFLCPRLRSR